MTDAPTIDAPPGSKERLPKKPQALAAHLDVLLTGHKSITNAELHVLCGLVTPPATWTEGLRLGHAMKALQWTRKLRMVNYHTHTEWHRGSAPAYTPTAKPKPSAQERAAAAALARAEASNAKDIARAEAREMRVLIEGRLASTPRALGDTIGTQELYHLLGYEAPPPDPSDSEPHEQRITPPMDEVQAIASAMKALGYIRERAMRDGVRGSVWRRVGNPWPIDSDPPARIESLSERIARERHETIVARIDANTAALREQTRSNELLIAILRGKPRGTAVPDASATPDGAEA
jgi:hypothetical protein